MLFGQMPLSRISVNNHRLITSIDISSKIYFSFKLTTVWNRYTTDRIYRGNTTSLQTRDQALLASNYL